jgi:predicted aspartyl protease
MRLARESCPRWFLGGFPGQASMHAQKYSPFCLSKCRQGIVRGLVLAGCAVGALWTEASGRTNPMAVLPQLGYEVVDLRRTGENHLFLFGQVNGRRRSCLVDTGWSLASVSTNTAARLNPLRVIEQLKLGRVVLTNEAVTVQDLRVNGRPAPYDVVLGCDFLMRHHAVVDCAHNRLYLRRSAPSPGQKEEFERRLRQTGWAATELKRHHPLALTCEVKINGRILSWLVDSGAVWSCLDAKTAQSLNLRSTPSPNRIHGPGASGQRELAVADLKQIQIGGGELRSVSVAVFDLTDWGLGADGKVLENVGGILGGCELAKLGAIIDCHELKLWLHSTD